MYNTYSASSKYVMVYPQGIVGDNGAAWQGPSYAAKGVDDIQFVADLVSHIKDNYCIDTDRIYASGKSNGGGFVDTLSCSDVGDQFAAFAMAAAALYTDTTKESCSKKRAILETHGDNDNTIPYAGGQGSGGPIPDVGKWVRFWGERNCGTGAPSVRTTKNGYHIQTFSCGSLSNVVTHYHMYAPAAHCWPNSRGDNSDAKDIPNGCGNSKAMDYTPVVLDWFAKWNLQNAPKQS
jgi:poly(3-hydroxybutyrate) depolymerase